MTRDEAIEAIRKLDLREGDCVVITSKNPIPQEQRHKIGAGMKAVLDSLDVNARVVVLDAGLDIMVLRTSELKRANDA